MSVDDLESAEPFPAVFQILRWRGAHQPGRRTFTHLRDGKERDGEEDDAGLSCGELDRRAGEVGALLQQHVRPGGRALLVYPPGLDFIVAFLGCLYAAVVAVPAYPQSPRPERTLARLRALTADAQPTVALASILPLASGLAASDSVFAGIRWLATDPAAADAENAWRETHPDAQTPAFLQYTSGSMSTSNGVMAGPGSLVQNEALIQRAACRFRRGELAAVVSRLRPCRVL